VLNFSVLLSDLDGFFHWLVCSVLLFHGGEAEHDVLTYHICVALLLLVCFLIENPVFCVF
jgi:hypothetical protein